MSAQETFVRSRTDGVEEYRISTIDDIAAPSFLPEIAGPEDLHVVLQNIHALDDNTPIIVPGFRWEGLWTQPQFSKYERILKELHKHPIIYYEPPELLRYKMPKTLKTYALQGNRTQVRKFNKDLEGGDIGSALTHLPQFFRAFMSFQRESLLKAHNMDIPQSIEGSDKKLPDAWRDPRADNGYKDYFRELVEKAKDTRNAHVVPPVPPVMSSSDQNVIKRMQGSNRAMASMCETANLGFGNPVYSYYHLYVDYRVLKSGSNMDMHILEALQDDLSANAEHSFAGVTVTFTGYDKVWQNQLGMRLEKFVSDISDIAGRNDLPVILPRSGWYGLHLTDSGAHGYSSLLNGKERYSRRGGGMPKDKPELKYGYTALYGDAVELDLPDLETYLDNTGGMTKIPNLPNQPPRYSPQDQNLTDRFGNARDFRIEFSKPRRLMHVEESREMRKGIKSGRQNPARRYLERSEHENLS